MIPVLFSVTWTKQTINMLTVVRPANSWSVCLSSHTTGEQIICQGHIQNMWAQMFVCVCESVFMAAGVKAAISLLLSRNCTFLFFAPKKRVDLMFVLIHTTWCSFEKTFSHGTNIIWGSIFAKTMFVMDSHSCKETQNSCASRDDDELHFP